MVIGVVMTSSRIMTAMARAIAATNWMTNCPKSVRTSAQMPPMVE